LSSSRRLIKANQALRWHIIANVRFERRSIWKRALAC
jgi:hypothetical protein